MNKDGEHAMLNLRCESQRHNNAFKLPLNINHVPFTLWWNIAFNLLWKKD
jgi:hypothetical protein